MNRVGVFVLLFLIAVGSAMVAAPAVFGGGLYEPEKVELTETGQVECALFGTPFFIDSFDRPGVWKPNFANYNERLNIVFGKSFQGSPCLFVDGENVPKCDTAWGVTSEPIPLPQALTDQQAQADQQAQTDQKAPLRSGEECRFALSFQVSTAVLVQGNVAEGKMWQNAVEWLDRDGKPISSQRYAYCANPGSYNEIIIYGEVPEGAASAVLYFGFDTPNIDEGKFVALRNVVLSIVDEKRPFSPKSSFCSSVISDGGKISWTADTPEGTSVQFQVAASDSLDGIRTAAFVGPDGTDSSYYTEPFEKTATFVRYKAILTTSGSQTPTLKSVTVGTVTDTSWSRRKDIQPPRVKIVSPSPTTDNRIPLIVEITDSAPILWSDLNITVDEVEATDQFHREGNRLINNIKTSDTNTQPWSDGLHTVDVSISDFYGNSLTAKKCFFIGEAPKTPKVTMRDDGMTLIDGQPFFPIGIYGVMKREFNGFDIDRAFAGLKEAGFNFAHSYSIPREDEFLAAAMKYDFKLWTVARFPDERFINIERHCPAILAWYLGDDTSANTTPSELFDRDDAVKALDPTRITTQADGVRSQAVISNYQDYVLGTDNFLPEIYPVRTTKPESARDCVAITICDMKRVQKDIAMSGGAPRSIWPIIQYFQGWGWQRFPTFDELNAMSFAALIHGGHGITWYTYGGLVEPAKNRFNYGVTTTPERWTNISTVATRIRDLSPVLVERTGPQPAAPEIIAGPKKDSMENDSISVLLKIHQGYAYLFTVNSTQEEIQARFTIPALDTTGEVMFEDRSVTADKGVFTDTFPGYSVHVYKFKVQ